MFDAILASLIISFASLVGMLLLKSEKDTILLLVAFAAGTFLGGFFLHVLPKISTVGDNVYALILLSFVVFAVVEKYLHFHEHFKERSMGIINLVGDLFHNFLDGLGIAGAFKVDPSFGWLFTFMVLAHEVPQELGDFAVLVYSGFERKKAILLNFLTALSAVIGVVVGWIVSMDPRVLVAIVGGSFLYIGASDLIPVLREEIKGKKEFTASLVAFSLGIAVMFVIKYLRV